MNKIKRKNPILEEWLDSKKNKNTRHVYRSAFRRFLEFSQMSPAELKEEIDKEEEKKVTERRGIDNRIRDFYRWLVEEKGLSQKLGATYVGAVMSFYRHYNYRCNVSIGKELKPIVKNRRVNLRTENVRKLVSHAKSLRDRAIILTLYQSGMDVGTLCSLKINHVWKGLEENEIPLRITLIRRKEAVEYNTFLAVEAIEAVRAYLLERKRKEGGIELDSPLFIKQGKKRSDVECMKPNLIQKIFRELAVETGLVTAKEISKTNWNPVRPHALRRAFSDTLRVAGVNEQTIDYMLGHKLRFGGAYFGEAYEQYRNAMDKLQVFGSTSDMTNMRIRALEEELREVKITLSQPIGTMDIRTASFLKETLLRMKANPAFADSVLESLDEVIREAKFKEVRAEISVPIEKVK